MPEKLRTLLDSPRFTSAVKPKYKTYNENKKIITQGCYHPYLYLINQGAVRIILNCHLNHSTDIHPGIKELGPDELFGHYSLFDDEPSNSDVICITAVELVVIEKKSLRAFMETHPDDGFRLISEIYSALVNQIRHSHNAIAKLYTWGIKAHEIDKHLVE